MERSWGLDWTVTRSDHQTKGKNNSCCRKYSARLNDCWALPSFYFWTSNPLSHEKELGFILGTISLGRHVFPGVRRRSVDECFWLKWLKKLQINKRKPIKVGFVDKTNKLSTQFWANSQIFVPRHCNFFIKITFKQHTTLYWFSHSQGCLVRLMNFLDQQRIPTKVCKKKRQEMLKGTQSYIWDVWKQRFIWIFNKIFRRFQELRAVSQQDLNCI